MCVCVCEYVIPYKLIISRRLPIVNDDYLLTAYILELFTIYIILLQQILNALIV